MVYQGSNSDGRVCSLGLEASIGEEITTYNYHATAEFDMWGDGNDYPPYVTTQGTWYNLYIDEAGVYEIRLQDWIFTKNSGKEGIMDLSTMHTCLQLDLFSSYLGRQDTTLTQVDLVLKLKKIPFYILMEQYEPSPEPLPGKSSK